MKKALVILIVSIILIGIALVFPVFADEYESIDIYFKDGSHVQNTADSYWTEYWQVDDYYEFYLDSRYGKGDSNYICVCDYVSMNPVSRETKKSDFKHVRDKAEALGHTAHYYDLQTTLTDQYGVSFLKSEVDSIKCRKFSF